MLCIKKFMTHSELLASMQEPRFYPHPVHEIKLTETHISYVFLTESFVYKVKKDVDFGFLDFSSLAKREFYCREELRLNKRLAPDMYLEVIPVRKDARGRLFLEKDAGGEIIEYVLKMLRLPEEGMLPRLLERGQAATSLFQALAGKLVCFHNAAEAIEPEQAGEAVQTLQANMSENFAQTRDLQDRAVSPLRYRTLQDFSQWFFNSHREILNTRALAGRFREGHGDLRMEHICVYQEQLYIFDCIEFNERFRCIDVAADLSFLLMDLEYNGYWDRAREVEQAYCEHSGDQEIRILLNFYKCYYACTRAKVAGLRSTEVRGREQDDALQEAEDYFALAFCYAVRLVRPTVILVCGLMGTGKSTLARNLAPYLGVEVLRSDVLRKELLDIPESERHESAYGQGIYTPEMSRLTYARLFTRAAKHLHAGRSVILDASFQSRRERRAALDTAVDFGARCAILECVCSEQTAKERLNLRMQDQSEASDGRQDLFQAQKEAYEPILAEEPGKQLQISTEGAEEECRDETLERLLDLLRG